MAAAEITINIDGKRYQLDDLQGLVALPVEQRQQLISLLETLKQRQGLHAQTPAHTKMPDAIAARLAAASTATDVRNENAGRAASEDADVLMAKLIQEEKRGQRPLPTMNTLYAAVAIIGVVVIFLIML